MTESTRRKMRWGNQLDGFGWPWTLTKVHDDMKRLFPSELAESWGEAMWTAPDLWRCP